MKNKLFVVCPFSCMETELRKKFGDEIYFLSSPGAMLDINDTKYMESITDFLIRKKISDVYFVNDVSCKFINRIIKREDTFGLQAEYVLEELYFDYYTSYFKRQPLHEQQLRLAELSIKKQISDVMRSGILGEYIHEQNIQLTGLVTSKAKNTFKKLILDTFDSNIYEF